MKKIVFVFIFVLAFIGINQVKAEITDTWNYYPLGDNYIDTYNHNVVDNGNYNYTFQTVNAFLIEPGKVYSLHSTGPFEVMTDYDLKFYDSGNNIVNSPTVNEVWEDNELKSINFTTPINSRKIKLEVDFKHTRTFPEDYNEILDLIFVFKKGNNTPIEPVPYEGPRDLQPVFEGTDGLYITDVNSPISVQEIKAYLRAYDETDGDVSDSIVIIEDTYTSNCSTLGLYSIMFRANDSNNNYTFFTVKVQVVDTEAPVFGGVFEIFAKNSKLVSIDDITDGIILSDNYDLPGSISLELLEDNYTNNYNIVGTYEIKYRATDTSGNDKIGIVSINVEDDIAPIFNEPDEHVKSNNIDVSLSEFIAKYTALDETDGDITDRIQILSDDYTINQYNVGEWEVTISVSDAANNTTTLTLKIRVTDNIGPVFYVDSTKIVIDLSINTYSLNNIINTLQASNIIKKDLVIEVIEDNYTPNIDKPGKYKVRLGYQGEELDLEIEVVSKLEEIEEIEELNIFQKILNFFARIFKAIANFFKFLFY